MSGDPELYGRLDHIDRQLVEITTAISGNQAMGHKGLVQRIETIELLHAEVPEVHRGIEARAEEKIAGVATEAREARSHLHRRVDSLWGEWNKAKYTAAGIVIGLGLLAGAGGTWVYNIIAAGG